MIKEFSKFFTASLKRTAQNVYPLVRKKEKCLEIIKQAQEELNSLQTQINGYQGPIIEQTGGYTTEDLVTREVIDTGKIDPKTGKTIKSTVYRLTYPDTIVPPAMNATETSNECDMPEMPSDGVADGNNEVTI